MDYCFHMAVTGWNDKVAKDMARLTAEEGINSYKFFMAYKVPMLPEELAAPSQVCLQFYRTPVRLL